MSTVTPTSQKRKERYRTDRRIVLLEPSMVNSNHHSGHSILNEDLHYSGNINNNNNSSLFHEFSFEFEESLNYSSFQHAVYDTALFDVLKVDPDDFASQITLMDLAVFKLITPDELTSCAWSSKVKLQKAFHIVQFTRRFNQVNFWTQGEVLRADILKNRIEILSHFIRIAKKLFDHNNIHGCMAVVMALQSAPIYRLERTWMGLSKRDRTMFNQLKDFVSSNENWSRLRQHCSQTKLPCIPYLGIYLTDIVRIDTLHPYRSGLETPQRRNSLNNICRIISEFQQSTYDYLQSIECVQNYLVSVRYIEELQTFIEDQNYRQSVELENDLDQTDSSLEKSLPMKIVSTHKHRRAFSDYNQHPSSSMRKTASLPCRIREEKSLLDDSVLASRLTDEIDQAKQSSNIRPFTSNSHFQGAIERKCLLKNYQKPRLSQWKDYWLVICDDLLFFYKEKSVLTHFRSNSHRSSYRENPSKCQSISDWLIVLTETKHRWEIQLSDLNRGSMYKFRCENATMVNQWFERFKEASNFHQRHLSENLIALD